MFATRILYSVHRCTYMLSILPAWVSKLDFTLVARLSDYTTTLIHLGVLQAATLVARLKPLLLLQPALADSAAAMHHHVLQRLWLHSCACCNPNPESISPAVALLLPHDCDQSACHAFHSAALSALSMKDGLFTMIFHAAAACAYCDGASCKPGQLQRMLLPLCSFVQKAVSYRKIVLDCAMSRFGGLSEGSAASAQCATCQHTLQTMASMPGSWSQGWLPPVLHPAASGVTVSIACHGRVHLANAQQAAHTGPRPWRFVVAARVPCWAPGQNKEQVQQQDYLTQALLSVHAQESHVSILLCLCDAMQPRGMRVEFGVCGMNATSVRSLTSAARAWVQHQPELGGSPGQWVRHDAVALNATRQFQGVKEAVSLDSMRLLGYESWRPGGDVLVFAACEMAVHCRASAQEAHAAQHAH